MDKSRAVKLYQSKFSLITYNFISLVTKKKKNFSIPGWIISALTHEELRETEYPIKVTVPMGLDGGKIEIKHNFELVDATQIRLKREDEEKELDEARHNRGFQKHVFKVKKKSNRSLRG